MYIRPGDLLIKVKLHCEYTNILLASRTRGSFVCQVFFFILVFTFDVYFIARAWLCFEPPQHGINFILYFLNFFPSFAKELSNTGNVCQADGVKLLIWRYSVLHVQAISDRPVAHGAAVDVLLYIFFFLASYRNLVVQIFCLPACEV